MTKCSWCRWLPSGLLVAAMVVAAMVVAAMVMAAMVVARIAGAREDDARTSGRTDARLVTDDRYDGGWTHRRPAHGLPARGYPVARFCLWGRGVGHQSVEFANGARRRRVQYAW